METSSVVLVCILVTCSVWTVQGRILMVNTDDQEHVEISAEASGEQLPGVCWVCKWALNKVKKAIGPNATAENISSKLKSVCDQIGFLKSMCRKFMKVHLAELIEELSTTDVVKTICVNIGACKPKELLDLLFYDSDKDSHIEMKTWV